MKTSAATSDFSTSNQISQADPASRVSSIKNKFNETSPALVVGREAVIKQMTADYYYRIKLK